MSKQPAVRVFDNPDVYPAKTLDQPFAGAVLLAAMGYAAKSIETRPARFLHCPHPVVICAGQRVDKSAVGRLYHELVDGSRVPWALWYKATSLFGKALALVTVVESRLLTAEDFPRSLWWDAAQNATKPRYAWSLADMKALEPFAWKGRQGWSAIPRATVDAAVTGGAR